MPRVTFATTPPRYGERDFTVKERGWHDLLTGQPDRTSQTFNHTGAHADWVVPANVTAITVDAYGAQGGGSIGVNNGLGGRGGRSRSQVAVTPGETLRVFVGGQGQPGPSGLGVAGGFNGGADGGTTAGGGGGATDIRRGPYALADRLVVAGGGGGAGGNDERSNVDSGVGGGAVGGEGATSIAGGLKGGHGATQAAGGAGGANGTPGTAGDLGVGGAGGATSRGGGGGGGGYYGGGGGAGANTAGQGGGAGAGGSGLVSGTSPLIQAGVRLGHGTLEISYDNPAANVIDFKWARPNGPTLGGPTYAYFDTHVGSLRTEWPYLEYQFMFSTWDLRQFSMGTGFVHFGAADAGVGLNFPFIRHSFHGDTDDFSSRTMVFAAFDAAGVQTDNRNIQGLIAGTLYTVKSWIDPVERTFNVDLNGDTRQAPIGHLGSFLGSYNRWRSWHDGGGGNSGEAAIASFGKFRYVDTGPVFLGGKWYGHGVRSPHAVVY